jgi:galactose-1-phosphate uridylyltransferase
VQDLLNQLVKIALKSSIEPGPQMPGNWYMFSDYDTGIKAHDKNKMHPCFTPGGRSIKNGRLEIWFRSTSREGLVPEYLMHPPHRHPYRKECPCNVNAYITLRGYKSIPAELILRTRPRCTEDNQEWLVNFQRCLEAVQQLGVSS